MLKDISKMLSSSSLLTLSLMVLAAHASHHHAKSPECPLLRSTSSSHSAVNVRHQGFQVITTTTIEELPALRSQKGPRVGDYINDDEIAILQSTWNVLKNRGAFAPKIFIRYLKAKPGAQRLFPAFSHVPLSDLPNNPDFLLRAYSCVNSLNAIISTLKSDISPSNCPIFAALRNKYKESDVKSLNVIWMKSLQEELGSKYTQQVRNAWRNAFDALIKFSSSE